jgi:hypothetical protein
MAQAAGDDARFGQMEPCHTKPFILPGVLVAASVGTPSVAAPSDDGTHQAAAQDTCDYCGSAELEWRKCKLICVNCAQINKSCADL